MTRAALQEAKAALAAAKAELSQRAHDMAQLQANRDGAVQQVRTSTNAPLPPPPLAAHPGGFGSA